MRYLKEYIDFLDWEGRIKELSESECIDWKKNRKWMPFTEKELQLITDNYRPVTLLDQKKEWDINNGKYEIHYLDENWVDVNISKWDDSWYVIRVGAYRRRNYLCDEIDSVIMMVSSGIEELVAKSDFFK